MSYRSSRISVILLSLFVITFGYTNCSPVHQNDSSGSLSSLGDCEGIFMDTFEKTFLSYTPDSTVSCSTCHSDTYMNGNSPASSWTFLSRRLGSKEQILSKLFENANGENPDHSVTFGQVSETDKASVANFKSEWDSADSGCGE